MQMVQFLLQNVKHVETVFTLIVYPIGLNIAKGHHVHIVPLYGRKQHTNKVSVLILLQNGEVFFSKYDDLF